MAISITDPELQAQLEADTRDGLVPVWDPNDEATATAFVDYFNNLTLSTSMRLVATTTYNFEIVPPKESSTT